MRPLRRLAVGGAVMALLGGTLTAPASAAPSAPKQRDQQRWVTLVTGDRVLVQVNDGRERILTERRGKGRDKIRFARQLERGDMYVIPSDAAPLVAQGRVDRRLFNVSKLIEFGYDDRASAEVPLIVTYTGGASARTARDLPSVNGDVVEVSKKDATAFWGTVAGSAAARSGGTKTVWLDSKVTASLDTSVPQVGAPTAWQAGHTGKGTTVAVLDTGIDTDHPDLADAVTAARNFTDAESGVDDRFGHGTHVAGIITGSGAASGGKYQGVAPDAKLLNGKVLDDFGGGYESEIIAGMQWAVEQGADVVNMSLGTPFPGDGTDPMEQAVNQLTKDSGTLFVISAGNSGPDGFIGSPGAADEALTVGAVDKNDALADFSSRGPRWGDRALKPDITAPGVDIVASLADGALLAEDWPVVDGRYLQLPGTSMAAPHVAGAAAILAGQHEDWDADELKPALMGSAKPSDGPTVYEQGAGRLDVARAVTQQVVASVGSVSNGTVRWPHDDDEPISKEITYRNLGTTPVTLDLTVDVDQAPAGMFTLEPKKITVPAGGSAAVTLVTNTRVPAADGTYGGALIASDGQTTVRTPVGVTREVESYDVKLSFVDNMGELTAAYGTRFVNLDREEAILPYDASGTVVARLPKGRYYFEAFIDMPDQEAMALLAEPTFVVDGDGSVTLDARQAKPVGFTVDRPEATAGEAGLLFERKAVWGDTGMGIGLGSFDGVSVWPTETSAPGAEYTFTMAAGMAKPDGAGAYKNSPYLYHLQWSRQGGVPAELTRRVRDRELAKVNTRIAAVTPGQRVAKDFIVEFAAPAKLTEYFTPGVPFFSTLAYPSGDFYDGVISSAPVTYRLGKPVTERWNVGPFGPAFPEDPAYEGSFGFREGNLLGFDLEMFGDQARNHSGWYVADTARVTLYRNGERIGEDPSTFATFNVPADGATFRVEAAITRPSLGLSTEVTGAWTFRSAEVADGWKALPLMAMRFAPALDELNRAPAGRPFAVPVYVQRQVGGEFGTLKSVTVQASYDDGKTWRKVPLAGSGVDRVALLQHPSGAGYVSLKAAAADSAGNTVEQTIIRAYALK
ncbi:S8 family serine peptidase [Actinomycetes bacterium KLBMP 9797]